MRAPPPVAGTEASVDAVDPVADRGRGVARSHLEAEFLEITGGLKMTQVAKFRDWCGQNGYSVPDMQKETLAKILQKDLDGDLEDEMDDPGRYAGRVPDNVHRALSIRQLIGSASIKKLARMQACVCEDGRVRGSLQYHGTGPGRSAGRLLQPHNFLIMSLVAYGTDKHIYSTPIQAGCCFNHFLHVDGFFGYFYHG